jgi:hypothetical protein
VLRPATTSDIRCCERGADKHVDKLDDLVKADPSRTANCIRWSRMQGILGIDPPGSSALAKKRKFPAESLCQTSPMGHTHGCMHIATCMCIVQQAHSASNQLPANAIHAYCILTTTKYFGFLNIQR